LPVDEYSADQKIVLEHWHANGGSRAAELSCRAGNGFGGVVGGMAHLLCPHDAIEQATRCQLKRSGPPIEFGKFGRRTNSCREADHLAVDAEQRTELGLAEAHRVLEHGLKHRLYLAG